MMIAAENLPLSAWLRCFGALRTYHRYEVIGLERLLSLRRSALLVGYHGRPIAYDLCMLSVTLHEHLGYMPHGIVHGAVDHLPIMKWVTDNLGFVTGDGPAIAEAVRKGELLCVQPGGTKEGCRSLRHRYRVDWGERIGYLKLSLRYGLPLIPVAARGIDDGYIGLNDGYELGKILRLPHRLPLWFGLGPTGLFPFSLPFPVKIVQHIGEPIEIDTEDPIDPEDRASLLRLHGRVRDAVQALLDRANPHENRRPSEGV